MTTRPQVALLDHKDLSAIASDTLGGSWKTVLFNDDWHSIFDVAAQIGKAIQCGSNRAHHLANVAHHTGSAVITRGSKEHCEVVAGVLEQITLSVAVNQ